MSRLILADSGPLVALFNGNDAAHPWALARFQESTEPLITCEAVLTEAAKFCEDVLTPLNRVGDREGCRRNADGSVTTPPGFKDAYWKLVAGGWAGARLSVRTDTTKLQAAFTALLLVVASYTAWRAVPALT